MHLQRLQITDFRNLKEFDIEFDAGFGSHAIIGQNGSGKSNLIEAIVTIFRDLDLKAKTAFGYTLEYQSRGHHIQVTAEPDQRAQVVIDGDKRSASYLSDHARQYLPSHVFAYYSGRSERIEALFQPHQKRFYDALLEGNDELMRRLFYCRNVHSQFVLLAYLMGDAPECRQILSDLNISALDSVLFVLKKPYWYKNDLSEEVLTEGDNRFWYARGVVQEFLDELWKVAIAPIDNTESRLLDYRGRTEKQDLLYLFVPDKVALQTLAKNIGEPARFFKYLESTYISDLIDEVRINVEHKDIDDNITFSQLSEGEQQLLTVLGLMRFTHEDESLFLLDEPDTHLNPIWKLRYFDEIEKVVKLQDDSAKGHSQLIVTTHDPMMVGSLKREQVKILRKQAGRSVVDVPDVNPQGMGVAGLLKSELFGLRSTVDTETLRRLDRRNVLFALDARTPEQNAELSRLSDELSDLGFASDFKDPYYAAFVKKMALHTKFHKEVLTPEELQQQDAIADDIISEILAEEERKQGRA